MALLYQRTASLWLRVHSLLDDFIDSGFAVTDAANHSRLQQLATLVGFTVPNQYPNLHHLLKHTYAALLARHTQ